MGMQLFIGDAHTMAKKNLSDEEDAFQKVKV
jgi:hypothetical protein